jgi:hypothetical protein
MHVATATNGLLRCNTIFLRTTEIKRLQFGLSNLNLIRHNIWSHDTKIRVSCKYPLSNGLSLIRRLAVFLVQNNFCCISNWDPILPNSISPILDIFEIFYYKYLLNFLQICEKWILAMNICKH